MHLVVFIGVLNAKYLGKILTQVVAGAGLQRAPVLHHGFHAVGAQSARKFLFFGLQSLDHRQRHFLLYEVRINTVEDHQRLALGILLIGVDSVALLPQEFRGPQKRPSAHLPAHHIGPLIDQQRQVAPRVHPLGIKVADDRLRRWPDHVRLGQFFAAGAGHFGDLRREALHMLGFLHQKTFGD